MSYVNKLRIFSIPIPDNSPSSSLSAAASLAGNTLLSVLKGDVFELQINPESYSRNFGIYYNTPTEQGASPSFADVQYAGNTPEELELKFTIDGTGVVPFQPGTDLLNPLGNLSAQIGLAGADLLYVTSKLAQLQAVVYDVKDEEHRAPLLLINWGKMVFVGVLQSMIHNHTLFHESGLSLRVEITLKIKQYQVPKIAAAALSLLSPDLTRQRTVKASDTLLNLCTEIYEKPDYYLEVAKANKLTNFRKLKLGAELILPPISQS